MFWWTDDSRQMLVRCKFKDTVKQFPVPMVRTLMELRQVIEPHIPAAMQPGVSFKLLKRWASYQTFFDFGMTKLDCN
jgi:hypothetical protein